MSDTTKIQWADSTFNPWIGCTKISAGCKNCYAENTTRARVLRHNGQETWGKGAKRSRTSAATWRKPLKWNKQTCEDRDKYEYQDAVNGHAGLTRNLRIFPSLCDWLDDEVDIAWLADFLKLIHDTPNLDWLLLTKRPENWSNRLRAVLDSNWKKPSNSEFAIKRPFHNWLAGWHARNESPSNIWFGVSAENQEQWDKRVGQLIKIPAAIRFVSVEPMLAAIEMDNVFWKLPEPICENCPKDIECDCGFKTAKQNGHASVDWVILGGESGEDARPCNADWIRDALKQCQAAGVSVFVKQLGSKPYLPVKEQGVLRDGLPPIIDSKGGNMEEWPESLRVREFPV